MFLKFHIFCCVNERPDSAVRECCMKKNSLELRNYMKKNGCYNCKIDNSKKCFCTKKNFLPVAEKIQKQIMQFKTNYRDMREAKKNAKKLSDILKFIESK